MKESPIESTPPSREYLLLILHELQDANPRHYLTEEDLRRVAERLNTTAASVYGVARYYTMFSLRPRGTHLIRVCRSPVCGMLGTSPLLDALRESLGIDLGETTADGLFTLEPTECLGQCDRSPAMMIGSEVYGPVSPRRAKAIIARLRERG